ncbi:MAG: hypothetical protein ACKVKG_07530, partial [Alphaproteobacteria bacterium]
YSLIGMSFMLSGVFDRRGQSKSLYGAIAVVTLIVVSQISAQNMATQIPAMIAAMYFAAIAPLFAGFYVIAGPQRRRFIPKGPEAPATVT